MNAPDQAISLGSHDPLSERAADFFVRRRFGRWREADQTELDAWLAESYLHRVAYVRVEGIAARADQLAAIHAFKIAPKPDEAKADARGKFRYWHIVLPLLAAASVALFAAFGIPIIRSLLQPPDRAYATDVGGRTLLKFTDGTEIELNTATAVRVRMTTAERTVWLEKGEAWFHVAHNAANPFSVVVGKHRIIDLGTEFFVRRGSGEMNVGLLKGRAMLSTQGAQAAMLRPGDEAVVTPVTMSVVRKTSLELEDELAWRRGMLVFRNARLADAIKEFNRYNTTKFVIADPSIAGLKFSAEIENDNFEGFLVVAKAMLNLRAERDGSSILLSRASRETTRRTVRAKRSSSEAIAQ